MPSLLSIRPFAPADQPTAKNLIQTGLGEHFGFIDPTLNPDLNDIWDSYITAGHTFVVAEWKGELVGTGALISERPKIHETFGVLEANQIYGRLVRMSVSPAHRRLGIGRALVEHLLQIAQQHGLTHTLVETNLDWYDAIGLYQRCGFVEYGRDAESVYMILQTTQTDD